MTPRECLTTLQTKTRSILLPPNDAPTAPWEQIWIFCEGTTTAWGPQNTHGESSGTEESEKTAKSKQNSLRESRENHTPGRKEGSLHRLQDQHTPCFKDMKEVAGNSDQKLKMSQRVEY